MDWQLVKIMQERFATTIPNEASKKVRLHGSRAFTLIELLIVIAIIALMSTLLVPAMRGMLGISGVRGGSNTLSAALDQARLTAMQYGTEAYAGIYTSTNLGGSSAVIILRNDGGTNKAVSKWTKLPQGVYVESEGTAYTSIPPSGLPKLGAENMTNITALTFDRFGKLKPDTTTAILKLGLKTGWTNTFTGSPNNYIEMSVQPLTGRVVITDKRGS